jgi:caffeoyl-CoA O-methyltransferase
MRPRWCRGSPGSWCRKRGMDLVDPRIERFAIEHTTAPSEAIAALRAETEAKTPFPQMAGGLVEVRLLEALVVATRARRVLEIGTFTGVSALSIAARLPSDGVVVTLESNPEVLEIARRHIEASPYSGRIELIAGDALEAVAQLEGPYDLVFIDAWKRDYAAYYEAVVPKLAEHGVIVADNVLLGGRVLDDEPSDDDTVGIKAFVSMVCADDRVDNALLTIGDGLLLIWKRR